jgi:uncharacterized membrane protein required for colicin V production
VDGPLLLDVVIGLLLVARTVMGFRTGLLAGSLSLAGVVGGAALGWWAGPHLLGLVSLLDSGRMIRSVTLVVLVLVGIGLGELLLGGLGRSLRGKDRARGLDAFLGGITALLVVCLVSWFTLAAVRPIAPAGFARAIDGSHAYRILDDLVPDRFNKLPSRAVDALTNELPRIFGGEEPLLPIPEPDSDALDSPAVQQAAASIVKVRTDSPNCRTDSTGSGWVVAPGRVVTNAHVVAGSSGVSVAVGGASGVLHQASVVAFDPALDLAVLVAPTLEAPALARAGEELAPGTDAVAAGFPWGGPFSLSQTRVRGVVVESGTDIYGAAGVQREVYSVRGTVRPGNSGGPLLTDDGRVAGTVFAMSAVDPQTGYALTDATTAGWLDAAAVLTEPVPTGACMTR